MDKMANVLQHHVLDLFLNTYNLSFFTFLLLAYKPFNTYTIFFILITGCQNNMPGHYNNSHHTSVSSKICDMPVH